jgi:hypothetical protein
MLEHPAKRISKMEQPKRLHDLAESPEGIVRNQPLGNRIWTLD